MGPEMNDSHEKGVEFDAYYKSLIDKVNYKRRNSRSGHGKPQRDPEQAVS